MDIRKLVPSAALLLFACPILASAATPSDCAQLSRNLRLGMSGADVKVLQILLNSDAATTIATTGPGSSGQESEYFGKKTQDAVVRFQDLHKNEVLTPANLAKGTGFVGALSRAKLVAQCKGVSIGNTKATAVPANAVVTKTAPISAKRLREQELKKTQSTSIVVPQQLEADKTLVAQDANKFVPMKITNPWMGDGKFPTPMIAMTSDTLMNPGDTFTLYGVGFTGDTPNTLHIGDKYTISNLGVDNTGIITFKVPKNVPLGRHYIWVTNAKGTGNKDQFVIVPTPGRAGPVVRLGTPSSGKVGTMVTVYGTGFATTWNDIHFPTQIISGVASVDGKSLSFKVPPPEIDDDEDISKYPDIVSTYSIVNDYGVWDDVPFTVTFK